MSADDRRPITEVMGEPDWPRFSVGYCVGCGEGHSLVDGRCFDCRHKEA